MRDFKKFMEQNRAKLYALADTNSEHDAQGHCLLSKDDPWMQDDAWDRDYERLVRMDEETHAAAN